MVGSWFLAGQVIQHIIQNAQASDLKHGSCSISQCAAIGWQQTSYQPPKRNDWHKLRTLLESHAVRLFLHLWSWLIQLFIWRLTVQLSVFLHSANTECTNVTWTKCSCCLTSYTEHCLHTVIDLISIYLFIYFVFKMAANGRLMYRPNFCNYDIPQFFLYYKITFNLWLRAVSFNVFEH